MNCQVLVNDEKALGNDVYIVKIFFASTITLSVKVAKLCPTLCNPMDYTVHGILQARVLEWVAFAFSRDLPNPGIEPRSPTLQADSLSTELSGKPSFVGKTQ